MQLLTNEHIDVTIYLLGNNKTLFKHSQFLFANTNFYEFYLIIYFFVNFINSKQQELVQQLLF